MPKALLAAVVYIALVPINFDHVMYGPGQDGGDELELTDAQAKQLLEVNAIKLKEDAADADDAVAKAAAPAPVPAPAAKAATKK